METKFKIKDKVYNALVEKWCKVCKVTEEQVVIKNEGESLNLWLPLSWANKILGFKEEKIKMSDEFYKSPKKTWEELKKEIESCEKEWVNNEDNYYLVLNHSVRGIREANFNNTVWIRENKKYYNEDVRKLVREVEELNYTNEFESWLLRKEEPKEDYPNLTGLEPVGTVGYMNNILSEVSALKVLSCKECSNFIKCLETTEVFLNCQDGRDDEIQVYYKKVTKRA